MFLFAWRYQVAHVSGRVSMALDKFSKKVLFLLSTCPSYDRPLFVIITI